MEIPGLTDLTVVGRGGFGVVYRARQASLNRTVAVKVLPTAGIAPDAVSRFERECQALGAMSGHPNIVALHGTGHTEDGSPYLPMDFLPGGSLAERPLPLPPADAVRIAVEIAGALETAHRAGIVHRDVKPENILVSAFGKAQLADFGIATLSGGFESRSGNITASLAHAAPEVLSGQRATPASDVYSLGSTLFQLLFGRPAFVREDEDTIGAIVSRVALEPVPDLRADGLPDELVIVVERSMRKEPTLRPPTAQAFADELLGAARALGYPVGEFVVGPPVMVEPTGATPEVAGTAVDPAPLFVPVATTAAGAGGAGAGGAGAAAVAVAEPPPGEGKRRVLIAAIAVVAVLIIVAVAVLALGDDGKNTNVVTDPGATTSTSGDPGTSTSTDLSTTSSVPGATTIDPNATTTSILVIGPTTTPTTGGPTTQPPTTKAPTTTVAVAPPGQPQAFSVLSATAPDEPGAKPATVQVQFSWSAPSGGGPVIGYEITQVQMSRSAATQSSTREAVVGAVAAGSGSTFSGAFSYIDNNSPAFQKWTLYELRAFNTSATGQKQLSTAALPFTIVVPDVIGFDTVPGAAIIRMAGFPLGFPGDCKELSNYKIRHESSSGLAKAPGTLVNIVRDTPDGSGPC